jgi:hypothetical protein
MIHDSHSRDHRGWRQIRPVYLVKSAAASAGDASKMLRGCNICSGRVTANAQPVARSLGKVKPNNLHPASTNNPGHSLASYVLSVKVEAGPRTFLIAKLPVPVPCATEPSVA